MLKFFLLNWLINKHSIDSFIEYLMNVIIISKNWDITYNLIFIIFYLIIVTSSLGVLLARNPIHSVFFLILVFLNVSFLLLLLHVEFLAFLILIVYLGAIAVLFLFVIMMFNIHILESRDNIIRYIPLVIIMLLMIIEICYITDMFNFKIGIIHINDIYYQYKNWYNLSNSQENIVTISIIYNFYFIHFILASLILLVAMIGAIFLTLNQELDLKRQKYNEQNRKNLYNSLSLKQWGKQKIEIWEIYYRKLHKYGTKEEEN